MESMLDRLKVPSWFRDVVLEGEKQIEEVTNKDTVENERKTICVVCDFEKKKTKLLEPTLKKAFYLFQILDSRRNNAENP